MAREDAPLSHTGCPGRERLAAFNEGRLPPSLLESVAEHLAQCPPCATTLTDLRDEDDSFLARLRASAALELPPEEAEYLRMQATARRLSLPPVTRLPSAAGLGDEPHGELGQYRLLEVLGRGGMGVVYKALHLRLRKEVAVKVLPAAWARDAAAVARFLRETETAGGLRHPHVVEATDAGEAAGFLFLVMEFLDGLDLARLVRAHGPLPVPAACEAVRQAALGLHHAHERGLVHRDIKPSNLMVTAAGTVKVLDLGLARLQCLPAAEEPLTESGQVMGTADYMAPEQAADAHTVDIRADLYSLGCTLYKLLTGQPPFGGPAYDSHAKKLLAHARAPVPPLTARRSDIPAGLLSVVGRLLAKEPADRYATPAAAAAALAPFTSGADLAALVAAARAAEARAPGPPPGSAETPRSRHTARGSPTPANAVPAGPPTAPTQPRTRPQALRRGVLAAAALVCLGTAGVFALQRAWGPDDAPAPLVWQPLLTRPPVPLFWEDASGASRLEHFPEKQELRVTASNLTLVGLGKAPRTGYQLEARISQLRWPGGTGIFVGGHKIRANGKAGTQYQIFEFTSHAPAGRPRSCRLRRWLLRVWDGPAGGHSTDSHYVTSVPVPVPGAGDCLLQLVVGRRGLEKVRWGGLDCPKLADAGANQQFPEATYLGDFGAFNYRSHAIYRNAQWMLFERKKP